MILLIKKEATSVASFFVLIKNYRQQKRDSSLTPVF